MIQSGPMQTSQAPLAFQQDTVRNFQQLPDQPISAQLQPLTVNLQKAGFGADLDLYIYGTITTGTGTSGNWDTNFFPYSIIRRCTLTLNTGLDLVDVDGYGLALINGLRHRATFPNSPAPAAGGFNQAGTTGPRVARFQAPSGALADSTAYKFGFHLRVPIACDDGLSAGLVMLQNQAYQGVLNVLVGAFSDWGNLGAGATISATMRVTQRMFSVPNNPESFPDLTYVHQWLMQRQDWTSNGQQQYPVLVGPVVLRVISSWINNNAPQPFFGTASDPTTPQFGTVQVQFNGSQRPEVYDFRVMIQRMYEDYGYDMPNGVLVHDFTLGGGSEEAGVNGRDLYDTGQLTDFSILTDLAASPTGNSMVNYYRELLVPSP